MGAGFSLYLDALRLGAALAVLFSHLGHGHLVGGLLWPFTRWGGEAVITFFVLSGFVIAHVVNTRPSGMADFLVARVARLFSVILPAMLLTFVLDAAGRSANPGAYVAVGQWRAEESAPLNYLLSFFMLNQSWGLNRHFGSNGAYWSIPFEFWYYVLFGAFCLMRGWARWAALAGAALLAGPRILALLPVWLLGVAAYRVMASGRRIAWPVLGSVLTLAGAAAMLLLDLQRPAWLGASGLQADGWAWQGLFGLCIAAHLVCAAQVRVIESWRLFVTCSWPAAALRFAAGVSFSLYMFHLPVLNFLHAFRGELAGSALYPALLIIAPLLLAGTVGHWCELQKVPLRRLLARWLRSPAGHPMRSQRPHH
jgi:peptidoglycan/LPS O-acetylase OafA/YrhL